MSDFLSSLSPETARRLNELPPAELTSFVKTMGECAAKGGDDFFKAERFDSILASASHGQVGPEALQREDGKTFSQWDTYKDPGAGMDPHRRSALLEKGLKEVGYKETGYWTKSSDPFGAFIKDLTKSGGDASFKAKHHESYENVSSEYLKAAGVNSVNAADGGFLVQPEFSPDIESIFIPNRLPSMVDRVSTNATRYHFHKLDDLNRNEGQRHGGVYGRWIDEGRTGEVSYPQFSRTTVDMKKLAVFVPITEEMMSDSDYNVAQRITQLVRNEIDFMLAQSIMWGQDGPEPLGFARSSAMQTVAATLTQGSNTIVTENILQMESQLFTDSGSTPTWLSHKSTGTQIGMLDVGSMPVNIHFNRDITQAPVKSLRGVTNLENELCSPLGSPGDLMLIDAKAYKAISASLIREDISMHVHYMSDQQLLRFVMRFGGKPLYDAPVTPYKSPLALTDPDVQSPFLMLAGRP